MLYLCLAGQKLLERIPSEVQKVSFCLKNRYKESGWRRTMLELLTIDCKMVQLLTIDCKMVQLLTVDCKMVRAATSSVQITKSFTTKS